MERRVDAEHKSPRDGCDPDSLACRTSFVLPSPWVCWCHCLHIRRYHYVFSKELVVWRQTGRFIPMDGGLREYPYWALRLEAHPRSSQERISAVAEETHFFVLLEGPFISRGPP